MLTWKWGKGNIYSLLVELQASTTNREVMWKSLKEDDPAVLLLRTYIMKFISYYRNTCSSMFIYALLTVDKKWKQPRCP